MYQFYKTKPYQLYIIYNNIVTKTDIYDGLQVINRQKYVF
jgi:hypothetical protein